MKRGTVLGMAVVVGVIGYFGLQYYAFDYFFIRNAYYRKSEAYLLRDTNHSALLEACRELAQRADELGLKRGREYRLHVFDKEERPEPEAMKLPTIIRALDPVYVRIDDDAVWVVFAAGLAHAGVVAYLPEHMKGPFVDFIPAEDKKELVPGLWFCDDACDHKRIDALIEEGKKHQHPTQGVEKDVNALT